MNSDIKALYIHIPFCISKCQYCDFFSVTHLENKSIPQNYIDALCKEIIYRLTNNNCTELSSIYIGGGTPSLLTQNQINQIISSITDTVSLSIDYEFTIEANPDDITKDFLTFLKSSEINRISVGLQSMNQECLSFSKRRATKEQNLIALKLLSELFPSFSVDLICGLPGESQESFLNSLETIFQYKPKHISMYSLTIEDETPFGKLYNSGKLNYDFDFSDELWLKARSFLEKHNYSQYEVSNFADKENCCKHNLVYWNHKSYLGCGSGGTGTVYSSNGTGFRWTNTTDIKNYTEFWNSAENNTLETLIPSTNEEINLETSKFEFFMMGLRKLDGITDFEYKEIFNEEFPSYFLTLAEKWNKDKLLQISNEESDVRYSLNSQGILFLNTFLESLLQAFTL